MFGLYTLNEVWSVILQFIDIACVWAVIYYGLRIVKNNSRTIQIFKGLLLLIIVRAISAFFNLTTMASLADSVMNWGVIAVIVLFQPEIRNILEKIGKTNLFSRLSSLTIDERAHLVDELVKACDEMSKSKTGALISLEQGHSLSDYIKTGTPMDSMVSSELLCSIFQYGTPLHDGAVIIQGVKIACAAAYFPPTIADLPTSYGARHRAAVGISEISDSLTIVVSEESGNISIAKNGKLNVKTVEELRVLLMDIICGVNEFNDPYKSHDDNSSMKSKGKKGSIVNQYFKGKKTVEENNLDEEDEIEISFETQKVIPKQKKEAKINGKKK